MQQNGIEYLRFDYYGDDDDDVNIVARVILPVGSLLAQAVPTVKSYRTESMRFYKRKRKESMNRAKLLIFLKL